VRATFSRDASHLLGAPASSRQTSTAGTVAPRARPPADRGRLEASAPRMTGRIIQAGSWLSPQSRKSGAHPKTIGLFSADARPRPMPDCAIVNRVYPMLIIMSLHLGMFQGL